MKKKLNKISLMLYIMMIVVIGFVNQNTIVSYAASKNTSKKVLLVHPYSDAKGFNKINSVKGIVDDYYKNITSWDGSKINYSTSMEKSGNYDIVVISSHGSTKGISMFKNGKRFDAGVSEVKKWKVKKNSIYIISACSISEKNTKLAQALIDKGAKAVYTYDKEVMRFNSRIQIKLLTKYLSQGLTPIQAFKNLGKNYGNSDMILNLKK